MSLKVNKCAPVVHVELVLLEEALAGWVFGLHLQHHIQIIIGHFIGSTTKHNQNLMYHDDDDQPTRLINLWSSPHCSLTVLQIIIMIKLNDDDFDQGDIGYHKVPHPPPPIALN